MTEKTLRTFEKWLNPGLLNGAIIAFGLLLLIVLNWVVVWSTGGTFYAYLHLFYIPIILAGFFFSVRGGLITSLVCGFIVGPYMPILIQQQIYQPTYSWLTRMVLFIMVGVLSGVGSSIFRRYIAEVKDKYTTNPVTNLPNYLGLRARFLQSKDSKLPLGLIVMDIRNYAEIELAVGPSGVQSVMRKIANDLKNTLPKQVTLGHPQGGQFILLVEDPAEMDAVTVHCQKYVKSSYEVGSIPIFVEKFFGLVSYPDDGDTFSNLLRKARLAISHSSKMAKNVARFDSENSEAGNETAVLLTNLNKAIEEDALDVYYQPKINAKTGKVQGVEALTRWFDPIKGDIEPSYFIPLTERTLLINPFTKWLLNRTLKDMSRWQKEGVEMNLAVNFSMRNFHDSSVLAQIFSLAEEYNIASSRIEVEITESAFSMDMKRVIAAVEMLRSRGVKISIDDFGTGLASQQYLFELPVDGLKIDKIFIKDLVKNKAAQAIVKSAVSLGHKLDLEVVAEGVETKDQYKVLVDMGCDVLQGFCVAEPMPYDKLMQWLKDNKKKHAI